MPLEKSRLYGPVDGTDGQLWLRYCYRNWFVFRRCTHDPTCLIMFAELRSKT